MLLGLSLRINRGLGKPGDRGRGEGQGKEETVENSFPPHSSLWHKHSTFP